VEVAALQYIPLDKAETQDEPGEVPQIHGNEFGAVPSVSEQGSAARQMHCLVVEQDAGGEDAFGLYLRVGFESWMKHPNGRLR
jgi:hypothetical protein